MKSVKVLKKEAEKIRRMLANLDLLNSSYKVTKLNQHVLIPIKEVTDKIMHLEIVEKSLKKIEKESTKLRERLKGSLTEEELERAKRAYDIIGDIAITEIPEGLEEKEKEIGEALLKLNKNLKVVAKKAGAYKGEFRTRKLKVIAGEKRKETLYRENGVRLKLNVETCYFSPRLSTERKRISQLVIDDEEILVMFSGVGPYPIVLSKNTGAKEVYGVEINPEAAEYAEENVKLNKCKNVKLFQGDVKKVVPKLGKKFDRILMPLPKSAEDFLDIALSVLKKGGIIHLYDFLYEREIPDKAIEKIQKHTDQFRILKVVKCGQYSPKQFRVCVDFKLGD